MSFLLTGAWSCARYNRSQNVQRLRWQLGAVLPADLQEKLNFSEKEFFKNYSDLLGSYMTNINLDLTVVGKIFTEISCSFLSCVDAFAVDFFK